MKRIVYILIILVIGGNFYIYAQQPIIGAEYQGGILVYKNLERKLGLIVAKKDLSFKMSWERAKLECTKFNDGGYTDWRLPEIGEFQVMYNYFDEKNHMDENKGMSPYYYWSLSFRGAGTAYVYRFKGNDTNFGNTELELSVRPVRACELP